MSELPEIFLNIDAAAITQNRRLRAVWTIDTYPTVDDPRIVEQIMGTYNQYELKREEKKINWINEGF